jgi:hypothetical protein
MFAGADRGVKRRLMVIAGVFLLTALTNNSLITKTPALYMLIVGLWCARCKLNNASESLPVVVPGTYRPYRVTRTRR